MRAQHASAARDSADARILFGSGRSGTTWLLQELARLSATRPVFEPFHPVRMQTPDHLVPLSYVDPDSVNLDLHDRVASVLSGRLTTPWTEQVTPADHRDGGDGRVIKEIHTHLWAGWLQRHFPHVPVAVVVRHPFAGVGSRNALGWTDKKLERMMGDDVLRRRHVPNLAPLMDRASTRFERGVLLWAVTNRVLLRSLDPESLFIIGYEDAVANPAAVGDLMEHFGFARPEEDALASRDRERASPMAQPGAPARTGGDENAKWLTGLDPTEVAFGLDALDAMGFHGVFGATGTSDLAALRERVRTGLDG